MFSDDEKNITPEELEKSVPEQDTPPVEASADETPAPEPEVPEKPDQPEAAAEETTEETAEEPAQEPVVEPVNENFNWYVLRVQTGREAAVKETIDRRVKLEGMSEVFGRTLVPTETVSEIRDGKKRVVSRRTYAGYIFVEMEMTDDAQHLVNETPGVAGFVGVDRRTRTKPAPMLQSEVDKMLMQVSKTDEEPKVAIKFQPGESVKIKEGPFENFDGVVEEINTAKGLVKVLVTIFGRPTSVELEYWQIESN